jgi:hypothetical protein
MFNLFFGRAAVDDDLLLFTVLLAASSRFFFLLGSSLYLRRQPLPLSIVIFDSSDGFRSYGWIPFTRNAAQACP